MVEGNNKLARHAQRVVSIIRVRSERSNQNSVACLVCYHTKILTMPNHRQILVVPNTLTTYVSYWHILVANQTLAKLLFKIPIIW